MSSQGRSNKFLSLVCVMAVCLNFSLPLSVAAQSSDASAGAVVETSSSVDLINKQIIKKEIELLRFNTDFRNHYMAPNKNKQRRLKFYDAVGGGIANAGDITLMSQFWRYWKNPGQALANRGRLQAGAVVVMVAYLTLGGMYLGEGLYDVYTDYKGKKQKWDAKSVREKALAFKNDLDELMQQRQSLVSASASGNQLAVLNTEGKVLSGIQELGLIEFT